MEGGADVAETSYKPFGKKGKQLRLIVRRVKPTPGTQLALLTTYEYHAFITTGWAPPWPWRPTTAGMPK